MKGTIVSAWVYTCREIYGDDVTNDALKSFKINPNRIFTPTEDIEDKIALGIIDFIAEKIGKTSDEVWRTMGNSNIATYSKVYPAFFRYKNLYSFLKAMYDIHIVVTKRVRGAKPPILSITPVDKCTAHMTYSSPRGMFPYFLGMLEGASKYYNEKVTVETLERTEDFLKISITFNEEIINQKKYLFNNTLTFGFIRSLEAKIAILSLLFVGIPTVLIYKTVESRIALPIALVLSAIIPFIYSRILLKPIDSIKLSLDRLQDKELSLIEDITSGDVLEDINNRINKIKDSIKTDFVGYKGTTDELNVFADRFSEISTNMSFTSTDITDVVEQVAEGAISQAHETENIAFQLNKSVDSLSEIANKENQGKDDLELAVNKMKSGFDDLKSTSESLNQILLQFSKVEEKGQDLQNRANDVRNIIDTVEKISEQTNLLALNASIEAARVGEYGKGFAVVAMEIRKLAEGSKEAVQTINDILEAFINDIGGFVTDISYQYSILEDENKTLNTVAKENSNAVDSVSKVSKLIIDLTQELTKETDNITNLSSNIESLAAIAQENSASSEEVAANVQSYTEEISKMIESIHEFKKVSIEFSKDLDKYVV